MIKKRGLITAATCLFSGAFVCGCVSRLPALTGVSLTPSSAVSIDQAQTVTLAASVANDTAGVTWSLSPASGAGSLSGTSTTAATYNAPASVTSAVTATVTATSVTQTNQSASVTITVEPPPAIAATTLPAATVSTAYSATVSATGGIAPYTWSVGSGSLPTGLSLASSTTNSVTISGTPTTQQTATFTLHVVDKAGLSATSPALTIAVNGSGSPSSGTSLLTGSYAFVFSGNNSTGLVATGGTFTADGQGHITVGVEDFNSIQGPPKNQTFTGTYTLGSNNVGVLTFSTLSGSPSYAFAINSTGTTGRMIEFDSTGVKGSGEFAQQSVTTCTSTTLNGDYAFGISGYTQGDGSTPGPAAIAGRFTATSPATPSGQGSMGNGEMDVNTPGFVSSVTIPVTLSGTYETTSETGRCTMTLEPQSLPNLTFSVYPVSASEAFLVETDPVNSTTPFLTAGKLIQQVGSPFTTGDIFSQPTVGGLNGQFTLGTTYSPDVAVVQLSGGSGGSQTMTVLDNQGGSVTNWTSPFQMTYNSDTFGRVTTDILNPFSPVFYMIDDNDAFCVGILQNDPILGLFEAQSTGPFSAATIKGSFVEGTAFPQASTAANVVGVLTLDGVSAVTGTQDTTTSTASTAAQTITGTYLSVSTTTGSGTVSLTSPSTFTGSFFIVSPTKFILVTTTSGNANPSLIIVGN